MTGYQSKKKVAQAKLEQAKEILLQHPQKDIDWQREQQIKAHAKLDEEGMYLVHQTASYADNLGKSIVALGKQTVADIEQLGIQPAQKPWRESASDYERGFIDGMQKQAQRPWVGLTEEDDIDWEEGGNLEDLVKAIEAKLKEKNNV